MFFKHSTNFSLIEVWTNRRSGLTHVYPELVNEPNAIFLQAFSILHVSSIMQGFLPPSSKSTGVSVFAAAAEINFPKKVPPVAIIFPR